MFMDQQTYQIIGAAIDVHKELGRGFLEAVYQEALEIEFSDRGIPFQSQLELPIFYKGKKLKTHDRSDFVCYDDIIAASHNYAQNRNLRNLRISYFLRFTVPIATHRMPGSTVPGAFCWSRRDSRRG